MSACPSSAAPRRALRYLTTYLWKVLCSTAMNAGGSFFACCPCRFGAQSKTAAAKWPPCDMMTTHRLGALCRVCRLPNNWRCERLPFCTAGSSKLLHTASMDPSAGPITPSSSWRLKKGCAQLCWPLRQNARQHRQHASLNCSAARKHTCAAETGQAKGRMSLLLRLPLP